MTVSTRLRQQVAAQARYRCGYCQTQEEVSGIPLTIEHIEPKAQGGQDDEANLWLSCRLCNEAKGVRLEAADTLTGSTVPLYNPRTQNWTEHFVWDNEGTSVVGLTPIGRATVSVLSLNSDLRVRARAIWVQAGYHPPKP